MEEGAKVSETYFIDSKDDELKELLNLTELEIEKSEKWVTQKYQYTTLSNEFFSLNPIYANNSKLISYIAVQTPTESATPLLIQIINLLNLLVATYSKGKLFHWYINIKLTQLIDINLKMLLKTNVLPSRLTKDLLVVKLGINNNKVIK